jgi:hypothetical protein
MSMSDHKEITSNRLIFRVSVKKTNINFFESIENLIRKAEKQIFEMAARFRVLNNGSEILEQSIERSTTYSEELTLEKSYNLMRLIRML